MKRPLIAGIVLSCSLLAACGGGGGTPNPLPSATPATTYASKIVFVGALAGARAMQTDLRRAQSAAPMDTASTPIPIMVVSSFEVGVDTSVNGGAVQAVVSPLPSSSPPVAFTQTNPNALVVTPGPSASPQALPTGVIAQVYVNGTNAVQAQSAGTASATIGAPVDQTPTTPVYSYMSIALDCHGGPGGVAAGSSTPYTTHYGWKYNGATWAADDDVSDADIFIDGPTCVAQNASETDITVHVPGGDTRITTDTPFSAIAASQWATTETSFSILVADALNGDGSNTGVVIGKTRDGVHLFKLFPNALQPSEGYFGAIEVSGSSVDGF